MAKRTWRVRLGRAAELDFANIVKWTTKNFGARQARIYQKALVQTIAELEDRSESRSSCCDTWTGIVSLSAGQGL